VWLVDVKLSLRCQLQIFPQTTHQQARPWIASNQVLRDKVIDGRLNKENVICISFTSGNTDTHMKKTLWNKNLLQSNRKILWYTYIQYHNRSFIGIKKQLARWIIQHRPISK